MTPPDLPAFSGYLHDPLLLVDDRPNSFNFEQLPAPDRHVVAAEKKICTGLTAVSYRDGLVVFQITSDAKEIVPATGLSIGDAVASRVRLCNAHMACLHSALWHGGPAIIRKAPCTPMRLIYGVEEGNGNLDWRTQDPLTRALAPAVGRKFNPWGIGLTAHLEERWVPHRRPVAPSIMMASFDLLKHAISLHGLQGLFRYELLLKAATSAENHDFDLALNSAWLVAESAAAELWARVAGSPAPLGGGVSTRKPTSARTMLEHLRASGTVPGDVWQILDEARKARNKFVHELKPVRSDVVDDLLAASGVLLSTAEQTPFGVALLPAYQGHTF